MLYESAPAWAALFAAAAAVVFRPQSPEGVTAEPVRPVTTGHRLVKWSIGITLIAGVALAADAVATSARTGGAVAIPAPLGADAVVFVHGSWASRVAARLASAGMRRDSIETALRRNDICSVDQYARWRTAPDGAGRAPYLDLEPRPGSPPSLETRALSPGNLVRVLPGSTPDATCMREARSDRFGTLELELLAWQSPPLTESRVFIARDLGPAGNLAVLQAVTRSAYLYVDSESDDGPVLLEYAEGMELLWGGAAGERGASGEAGAPQ